MTSRNRKKKPKTRAEVAADGSVLIEEFHLTFFLQSGLTDEQIQQARHVLDHKLFRKDLQEAVDRVCNDWPHLSGATDHFLTR